MSKPVVHLICNAHLDPVWQWRWDEGAAEAITTFGIAARLLEEFPDLVFNHNEATLYRWVMQYDRPLFQTIQRLVAAGRWCIAGGWDIQPDVNMPGTEAIIRHIAEGRRFFREHFNVRPLVAYNFDSFGHSGGLPQILTRAGYRLYIHMRPEQKDLPLPAHLYRWRGVDGSEIGVYRIPFPAYNTFHGKAVERIAAAVEIALKNNEDTPVFWGLGDHGGGATRNELLQIAGLMERERRVEIVHSSTERYYEAVCSRLADAPVHTEDLQRVFTGCYTSMSRLKRRMQRNLGELVQTEGLCTAAWWLGDGTYPAADLQDAWQDHLFNDFHDILPGSSIEAGEQDALDLYGRSSETHRRLKLGAAAAFSKGRHRLLEIPLSVLNMDPGAPRVPVEAEYMIDHVPRFTGTWHARLFTLDGQELTVQEEAPASLLLVNEWRRKISFSAPLPHIGAAHFRLEMHEGTRPAAPKPPMTVHALDPVTGLLTSIDAGEGCELLAGPALRPLVVEDLADSWGMEAWSYRNVLGEFSPVGTPRVIEDGPVRRITESAFEYAKSSIILRSIAYAEFPFLEFRLRIQWNEQRKRLKLAFPTAFHAPSVLCEVPGGAIERPADGQEHLQGRWLLMRGAVAGRTTALAVINSGQYGFDVSDGELRLSVLRSPLYCHERTFPLEKAPHMTFMDQGTHEVRLLLLAGDPDQVQQSLTGLADWLSAPPYALPHLPIGEHTPAVQELASVTPSSVRLLACKRSWDGLSLVLRLQESLGRTTAAVVEIRRPSIRIEAAFRPFEIRTIRCEKDGTWREVSPIEED